MSVGFFRRYWLLTIMTLASAAFSFYAISQGEFLAHVGFLVVGTFIAIYSVLINDYISRDERAADLAKILYIELADRVARCCFDYEAPWQQYEANGEPWAMDSLRLRKFSPLPAKIFDASADRLALLEVGSAQSLIHFYYRLTAWQRDLENVAERSSTNKGGVAPDDLPLLAYRLRQTLSPGLHALKSLEKFVDNPGTIEQEAIATYDTSRTTGENKLSLRARLESNRLK